MNSLRSLCSTQKAKEIQMKKSKPTAIKKPKLATTKTPIVEKVKKSVAPKAVKVKTPATKKTSKLTELKVKKVPESKKSVKTTVTQKNAPKIASVKQIKTPISKKTPPKPKATVAQKPSKTETKQKLKAPIVTSKVNTKKRTKTSMNIEIKPTIKTLNPCVDSRWFPSDLSLLAAENGRSKNPHSVLGMHYIPGTGMVIRVFNPQAQDIIVHWNGFKASMRKVNNILWVIGFMGVEAHFKYALEFVYDDAHIFREDAYSFFPQVGDLDIHLFNEGTHEAAYRFMGAHTHIADDVPGIRFCVWAPNAERVSVVGDFNCWDGRRHMMRMIGASGIWELFIPRLGEGEIYKYEICARNGDVFTKLDPYATRTEKRPHNAGITDSSIYRYQWSDSAWMKQRSKTNWRERPMNIYEVHLASWQGPGLRPIDNTNEQDHHNYREIAHALVDYVKAMGYTHIELMPILEHPLDISWGYQVSAYYSPTARHGTPQDFAYFVDHMHQNGIGVLLDWVPAHYPKDAFALGRFDGTALYEHADPRQGEQQDWGTYVFNFGRCEVQTFLVSNALYWLEQFHIDGLRVDAVASMLYLDYSRKDGEWIPNQFGGNENLEAIDFMRRLNTITNAHFPGSMMIAEESTAWPGVSHPTYTGGLGFNFKWNMGWMHDVLSYFQTDPLFRSYHQNELTLPLLYFPTENFILPLSHDEVVHGKCSLLNKMPGDTWRKFANLRSLFAWMITHPGKKLIFMGCEFAQWIEWNCKQGLDWLLLDFEIHQKMLALNATLNKMYLQCPALWEDDFSTNGFQWIDASNYQQSIVSFVRWDKKRNHPVLIVMNLTPNVHHNYQVGVPFPEIWKEVINTDDVCWGGSGITNPDRLFHIPKEGLFHGQMQSISLSLPPLGATILMPLVDADGLSL